MEDGGGRAVGLRGAAPPAAGWRGKVRSGGHTCMQVGPRNRFPWSWHPRIHRRMHSRMHRRMHPGTPSWVVQPGIGFERLILSRAAVRPARDKINLSKRLAAGTRFSTPTHTHTRPASSRCPPRRPNPAPTPPAGWPPAHTTARSAATTTHPPATAGGLPVWMIHKRLGWVVG